MLLGLRLAPARQLAMLMLMLVRTLMLMLVLARLLLTRVHGRVSWELKRVRLSALAAGAEAGAGRMSLRRQGPRELVVVPALVRLVRLVQS